MGQMEQMGQMVLVLLVGGGSSYTDADARSACYPITQTNTGLSGTGSIKLFDTKSFYKSIDGYDRLYFANNGGTFIRAPNLTNSYGMTAGFRFSDGTLMTSAPSGDYNDLINKPTLPP